MHADKLVDYCAEVEKDEKVLIAAPPCASELVEALNAEVASRDAFPMTLWFYDDKILRAMKKNFDELPEPSHLEAAVEESDVFIALRSFENRAEDSDVTSEQDQEFTKTVKDFFEKAYQCRSVLSRHPTSGMAQHSGMATTEFEDFFYSAVDRDWSEVEESQQELADKLDEGSKLRIVSGETDLEMSIEGMSGVNLIGKYNMPGSEVLTAPVPDSVEGKVEFDFPVYYKGNKIEDIRLEFKDGRVTGFSASKNEEDLESLIDTDEGSDRVGEIGFGMNCDIDRYTGIIALDEKIGGTVHLALGRAYEESVGDKERNDSSVHVDMLIDTREKGKIVVDGEEIFQEGEYLD